MSVGKNIKAIREAYGLTQAEFAKKLEVSDKAVSSWELEERTPRPATVDKICQEFNLIKSQIYETEDESGIHAEIRFSKAFLEANKRPTLKNFYTKAADLPDEKIKVIDSIVDAILAEYLESINK